MGTEFVPSSWSVSIICFAARLIVWGSVVMGCLLLGGLEGFVLWYGGCFGWVVFWCIWGG